MSHTVTIRIEKRGETYVAFHPHRRSESRGVGACPLEATVALALDVAATNDSHRNPDEILP